MYGTLEVAAQFHLPRPLIARPPCALPVGSSFWRSRGARGRNRTGALPGDVPLEMFRFGCGPKSHLHWPSLPVAYCLLALSRLGYSPNLGFNTAYHTTSFISQVNTNQFLDKKSGGLPTSRQATPLNLPCSPVAGRPSPSGRQPHTGAQESPFIITFIIARSKKRTN